ncbi:MAG: AAA family ATPase [Elusimicrobia bacterium]|nr:AAA family ATPase [Elusimicrobiota bacterium]
MASKNLFLAGTPGVGKTSLIKEITLAHRDRLGGFYTEQILEDRKRSGFKIVTFRREEALLASKTLVSKTRLNKYGIDLDALERVAVASLVAARRESPVIVIDEIGAMEMLSEAFRKEVLECLACPKPVLATIRRGSKLLTESVERFAQTDVVELDRGNYETVRGEVRRWLEARLGDSEGSRSSPE